VVHLQSSGFKVEKKDLNDSQLSEIKSKYGVPEKLQSCHTAVVQGYVIEGHVPADLIFRVLKEKPPIRGLAVAGMPPGSPGMESPNPQPYEVLAFDKAGRITVYAKR
jgi:hypothetical protein